MKEKPWLHAPSPSPSPSSSPFSSSSPLCSSESELEDMYYVLEGGKKRLVNASSAFGSQIQSPNAMLDLGPKPSRRIQRSSSCTNKLSGHSHLEGHLTQNNYSNSAEKQVPVYSCPIDIAESWRPVPKSSRTVSDTRMLAYPKKHPSFQSDMDREEAWERKRDLHLLDKETELAGDGGKTSGGGNCPSRSVLRSVSDCGEMVRSKVVLDSVRAGRHRSLTDEDLEELRGCIDLGFGFKYDESCDLKGTLPALELYCAINKQYEDIRCSRSFSRSSPVSPLEHAPLFRTCSEESPCSPLSDAWRISSPGDHPNQVKTRLRHWAQAVACSVKQGFSL